MMLGTTALAEATEATTVLDALRRGEHQGPVDLRGAHLVDADLSGMNLMGADLSGANLSRADLSRANLMGACLQGTVLFSALLDDTELTAADLRGANLERATGARVGLGGAKLAGATMDGAQLSGASLTAADLTDARLHSADLRECRLREAVLCGADLTGADLRHADLAEADVAGAGLRQADLREASLAGVRGYEDADWIGADLRHINFVGAYLLRRFAMDQNYLHEFRGQSRFAGLVYRLWWLTSDCGRSLTRWALVCLAQVLLFAGLYALVDIDYGSYETWLSPIYYSVVTLTTLGYGDVLPASVAAQAVAMAEVVTGYLMLGGLLSIFGNKMARRAE